MTIVVVDPYSTGKGLVLELHRRGVKMVAIQSTLDLPAFWLEQMGPQRHMFEEVIVADAGPDGGSSWSTEQLADRLREKYGVQNGEIDVSMRFSTKITAVVPGSEPGVLLAEDLQEILNLKFANGAANKAWRRHKFEQIERLHAQKVRAARQIFAKSAQEAVKWQQTCNQNLWPVVVKPAMAGGQDGVHFCHSVTDVERAFEKELDKRNVNGEWNDRLVVQEFLKGKEYVVDCVSFDGKHVVCAIFEYLPPSWTPLKDGHILLPARGELQDKLVSYVHTVLSALDFKFGATHNEIMVLSHNEIMVVDGEPVLVEANSRLQGANGPYVGQSVTGLGQHELLADCLITGGKLHRQLYDENYRYLMKHEHATLVLQIHGLMEKGILSEDLCEVRLKKSLKNFSKIAFRLAKKGDRVSKTIDLCSALGMLEVIGDTREELFEALRTLRAMESKNFYNVVSEAEWEKTRIKKEEENSRSIDDLSSVRTCSGKLSDLLDEISGISDEGSQSRNSSGKFFNSSAHSYDVEYISSLRGNGCV